MIAAALAWIAGNRWAVAMAFLAMLAGFWAIEESRVSAAKSDASTARAETANIKEQAATAARLASEHYRAEEQRRAMRQKEIADEAEKRIAAAAADAGAAALASDQLRSRVAALVARGRAAACNPTPAASGPATEDALGVFADVLGRAETRARLLAGVADRAHEAGRICEFSYEALEAPKGASQP